MTDALLRLHIWFAERRGDRTDDQGAALVEYAFLVALIAIVCLLALIFLGGEASSSFDDSGNSISNAT